MLCNYLTKFTLIYHIFDCIAEDLEHRIVLKYHDCHHQLQGLMIQDLLCSFIGKG
jgi:hypothetical protein